MDQVGTVGVTPVGDRVLDRIGLVEKMPVAVPVAESVGVVQPPFRGGKMVERAIFARRKFVPHFGITVQERISDELLQLFGQFVAERVHRDPVGGRRLLRCRRRAGEKDCQRKKSNQFDIAFFHVCSVTAELLVPFSGGGTVCDTARKLILPG